MMLNGVNVPSYEGYPVLIRPDWDTWIAGYENGILPHRALFTTQRNMIFGTDGLLDNEDIETWYNPDLQVRRYRVQYKAQTRLSPPRAPCFRRLRRIIIRNSKFEYSIILYSILYPLSRISHPMSTPRNPNRSPRHFEFNYSPVLNLFDSDFGDLRTNTKITFPLATTTIFPASSLNLHAKSRFIVQY